MRKLLFILCLSCLQIFGQAQSIKSLNGLMWKGRTMAGYFPMNTSIPFNVHSNLYQQHYISDPYLGNQEQNLQWISDSIWVYETTFNLSDEFLKNENIDLFLDQVDTYCKVYLNEHFIGLCKNQFMPWNFSCKKWLKVGKNHIQLVFEPHTLYKQTQQNQSYASAFEPYAFHRKAAYQFGWDWGPKFICFGIGNCELRATQNFKLDDVQQSQKFNADSSVDLSIHVFYQLNKKDKIQFEISCLSDSNLSLSEGPLTAIDAYHFKQELKVHIIKPKLWWTANLGTPYLYKFNVKAREKQLVAFEENIAIGIRELVLVQALDPDKTGKSFYFKLNGIPVFMKGANLVPPSSFMNNLPANHYAKLTDECLELNMNMLRIWGGGMYLPDTFYKLCDQKGLLVWQDLMFAGSMYPEDSNWLASVKEEVIYQSKRLQIHPSLALFCGNNEISEAWYNWGWQKQYHLSEQDSIKSIKYYQWVFEKQIPEWISGITNTIYWPSSPAYGWGRAQSYKEGDSHYWGVWWGEAPFSSYLSHTGRFVSEYGFQGMPDLAIINKYMGSNAQKIDSLSLKNHQKHKRGFELIQNYMHMHFKVPAKFDEYVYTSQLLQAKAFEIAIAAHRNKQPYCMGSLLWQLNDCWPVTSWSILDFQNNRKAAFYQVQKSFEPLLMSFTQSNDSLELFILNDGLFEEKANIKLRLIDFKGQIYYEFKDSIRIKNKQVQVAFKTPLIDLLKNKKDSISLVLEAVYTSATTCKQALHYFCESKNLALQNDQIDLKIIDDTTLEIRSKTLQKNVWIYHPEKSLNFSDNFFDLLPNQSRKIKLEAGGLKALTLQKMSLNQIQE